MSITSRYYKSICCGESMSWNKEDPPRGKGVKAPALGLRQVRCFGSPLAVNLHAGLNPVAQVEQAAVRRVESIAHRAESALMCKRRVTTPARVLDRARRRRRSRDAFPQGPRHPGTSSYRARSSRTSRASGCASHRSSLSGSVGVKQRGHV